MHAPLTHVPVQLSPRCTIDAPLHCMQLCKQAGIALAARPGRARLLRNKRTPYYLYYLYYLHYLYLLVLLHLLIHPGQPGEGAGWKWCLTALDRLVHWYV